MDVFLSFLMFVQFSLTFVSTGSLYSVMIDYLASFGPGPPACLLMMI